MARNLEGMNTDANLVHVHCRCSVHLRSAFIKCRDDLFISYRYTEFGMSNSRFHTLGRSNVYEVPHLLWHAHLAPIGDCYHNDTFPATVAGDPPNLNPVASKF